MTVTSTRNRLRPTRPEKKIVLLVDDSPTTLSTLFDYLRGSGFRPVLAEDGEDALARVKTVKPDIILIEALLPGLDGFETCRRLKENPQTREIPLIFVTSLADTVNKLKGFQVGAVDYLTKPIQCEEILVRIKTHLLIQNVQENLKQQNQHLQQEGIRHRRVLELLQASHERYRLLAENVTDMIAIQSAGGLYRYVSPACFALLGYSSEEMTGRSVYEFLHPEDLPVIQEAIEERPPVFTLTYRARHKDNRWVWLETTNRMIYDPQHQTELELVSISRDVTEHKQSEEALQKAQAELERLVEERTSRLSMALSFLQGEINERKQLEQQLRQEIAERKAIEAKLQQEIRERHKVEERLRQYSLELETKNETLTSFDLMRDEFLLSMSHELRTPLTGIIGIAESMIDGAAGPLSLPQMHNLAMIVSSGRRLTKLINDTLESSKLKHEDLELKFKPVDLRAVTEVVLTLSQPLIGNKPVRLINNLDPNLPPVRADENRLQQIMHNLIDNAIKFTEKGAVTISADIQNETVVVKVSDTGIGIPADQLDIIFQSYRQVDAAVTKLYGGTGLGLSIVRQLVELHGGIIRAESVLDKGSDFIFTLPIHKWPVSASAVNRAIDALASGNLAGGNGLQRVEVEMVRPASSPELAKNKNHTILVVDDELINVQVLTNYLALQNYAIAQAFDGFEALEALEETKPDLILLDVMMPKLSGYEVCKKIRERYPAHELPIILLTAKDQSTDLLAGFEAGANDYLTKPFDKNELLVRVKTHLRLAKINIAYGRFVPHEFLRFLEKESIEDVHLGDQIQREMSILFSDIRSFTSLSEGMTPQESFNFLNAYLGRVSPVIREHKGFIDKYIGDALMALFPEKVEDALEAAIAMQHEVARYNQKRIPRGRLPIRVGIGLHTGVLMLGTIGEERRMEGTVIADAVNLASRIEGLTKVYGVPIVISEQTLFALTDPIHYHFRFLDRVKVKGKKQPISVFEVFDGEPVEILDLKLKTLADFENGLLHYHSQEFSMAKVYFERVLHQNAEDKAAQLYLRRSTHFMTYGVPPGWEGIEALTEK